MRKMLLFSLFSLFVFSFGLCQPDELKPDSWNFGKIRASGGIVKHTFSLKNDTREVLNVFGAHASCGCTAVEMDKKVILPGESANLEVKFDPKNYSGQVTQYVYVNTDSKAMPAYRFNVKADVTKD
jgi:hypothetical protein